MEKLDSLLAYRLIVGMVTLALAACTGSILRQELRPGEGGAQLVVGQKRGERSSVVIEKGSMPGSRGCRIDYLLYSPASRVYEDVIAVVGHGFLRSYEQMDGLARRLADAGVRTASVRFCNSRIWDGRHRDNGLDMIALAEALQAKQVAYVGFSAGGLAALVAGRHDDRTIGVVALDLVDRDGVGLTAAADLDRPLVGLVGPPSPCNAENNGLAALAANRQSRIHRFPDATHCDFESPTDWLCKQICGERPGSDARRQAILSTATDAVIALTESKSLAASP